MDKKPLQIRSTFEEVFPPWLVKVLGPYPEDVGRWPVVCKWFAIIFAWLLFSSLLVPSENERSYAIAQVIAGPIFIALSLLGFWFLKRK